MSSFQNDFRVKTFANKKKIEWRFQRVNVVRGLETERGHRLWVVGTPTRVKSLRTFPHSIYNEHARHFFYLSSKRLGCKHLHKAGGWQKSTEVLGV